MSGPAVGHLLSGCLIAGFALLWTALTLPVALLVVFAAPPDGFTGNRLSLTLHHLALFAPFGAAAVFLWGWAGHHFRRAVPWEAGLAPVRRTANGRRAVLPNPAGLVAALVVFTLCLFLTAAIPDFGFNRRNPTWFWALMLPVSLGLTFAAWRRFDRRTTAETNDAAGTLTLSDGRALRPLTVPFDAVESVVVEVRRQSAGESDEDVYNAVVMVRTESGPVAVRFRGMDRREPAERFVAWLRNAMRDEVGA